MFLSYAFCLYIREVTEGLLVPYEKDSYIDFTKEIAYALLDEFYANAERCLPQLPSFIRDLLLCVPEEARFDVLYDSFFKEFFRDPASFLSGDWWLLAFNDDREDSDFLEVVKSEYVSNFLALFLRADQSNKPFMTPSTILDASASKMYLDSLDMAAFESWKNGTPFPDPDDFDFAGYRLYHVELSEDGLASYQQTDFHATSGPKALRRLLKLADIFPLPTLIDRNAQLTTQHMFQLIETLLVKPGPPSLAPLRRHLVTLSKADKSVQHRSIEKMLKDMVKVHDEELDRIQEIDQAQERCTELQASRQRLYEWTTRRWNYSCHRSMELELSTPFEIMPSPEDEAAFIESFTQRVEKGFGDSSIGIFRRFARMLYVTNTFHFNDYLVGHPELVLADARAYAYINAHRRELMQFPNYERSFRRFYGPLQKAFADMRGPLHKAYRIWQILGVAANLLKTLLGQAPDADEVRLHVESLCYAANPPYLISTLAYINTFVVFDKSPIHGTTEIRCDIFHGLWPMVREHLKFGHWEKGPTVLVVGEGRLRVVADARATRTDIAGNGGSPIFRVMTVNEARAATTETVDIAVFACAKPAERDEAEKFFKPRLLFGAKCPMVEKARRAIFFVQDPGVALPTVQEYTYVIGLETLHQWIAGTH
jgi:hypothetical protein